MCSMLLSRPPTAVISAGLVLLALTCVMIYWPGLSGPFLFDDFANLDALGKYNGVKDWGTFRLFVFGNASGPTGRPIAMLSFLIDARNWPTDPRPFKTTNLVIHLFNGLLLFTLSKKLLSLRHDLGTASLTALCVAAIWLLHPLNVSTVLYPVQRMALLSTLFVLLGLTGYVHGRSLLTTDKRKAYGLMSISLVLAGMLATFSKENGALLPILALVMELTVLRQLKAPLNKTWKLTFLWAPLLLIIGYFIHGLWGGDIPAAYAYRNFTLEERLLTQPRVLIDYLYYWFIPHIGSPGLLTQDFPLSRSWLQPLSTAPALLTIVSLIVFSWVCRRRFPYFSMGVLFYFAGHLIESTVISLEIYFEHRNYLPAVFLFLPTILGLFRLINQRPLWLLLPVVLITLMSWLTWQRATIWSSEQWLARQWMSIHPYSQRALRNAALVAEKYHRHDEALAIMETARSRLPDRIAIQLHWLELNCKYRTLEGKLDGTKLLGIMRSGYYQDRVGAYEQLQATSERLSSTVCIEDHDEYALQILVALEENPHARKSPDILHQISHIRGLIYLLHGDNRQAVSSFKRSQNQALHIESALQQTALLATHRLYDAALEHLARLKQQMDTEHELGKLDYPAELEHLEKQIIKAREEHRGHGGRHLR